MLSEFIPSLATARYGYCEGPLTTASGFIENELLANCQLYAHVLLEELGFSLPKWLRSAELYRRSAGGKIWVDKVACGDEIKVGDLFLFSHRQVRHIQDPLIYRLHLGVCVDACHPTIAHISRYTMCGQKHPHGGEVYEQLLCDMLSSPRYNTVVGIRRPRQ